MDQPGYGAQQQTPYFVTQQILPRPRRGNPVWVTVLVGAVALAVGFAAGAGSKKQGPKASASTVATLAVPTVGPASAVPSLLQPPTSSAVTAKAGVGATIALKGSKPGDVLEVTLVKVVDPAGADNGFSSPDPGKRYVGLQFRLVNKGVGEYDDDPQADVKVKDAQGQSFDVDFATLTAGPALDSALKLPPGETALGYVTVQLPAGSKPVKVQYTLDVFGQTGQWTVG